MKWDKKDNALAYRTMMQKVQQIYTLMDFVVEGRFSDNLVNRFAELLSTRQEEANAFFRAHCA